MLGWLAQPGAATLVLRDALAPSVWEAGDEVVVSITAFHRCQSVGQNEERTVAAVLADGRAVTLSEPLALAHYGGAPVRYHAWLRSATAGRGTSGSSRRGLWRAATPPA